MDGDIRNYLVGWEPQYGTTLREALYDVIEIVPNRKWKEFARVGLGVKEATIEDISVDEKDNNREQKYHMCKAWITSVGLRGDDDGDGDETMEATNKLYAILNHFLWPNKFEKPKRKLLGKRGQLRSYCSRVKRESLLLSTGEHGSDRFLSTYQPKFGCKNVVIFNNSFTHSDKFDQRFGTEVDVANMKKLWEMFGCKVEIYLDLTAIDMMNRLKQFAADCKDIDYCVVIVMSHGGEGDVIYGESYIAENFVQSNEIREVFSTKNSPHLLGIPKLFFFQCSRGKNVDSPEPNNTETCHGPARPIGIYESWMTVPKRRKRMQIRSRSFTTITKGSESEGETLPPLSDMLVCFAAAPGYSSFRDPRNGSWFINAISNIFMKYANKQNIVNLLIKVNEAMAEKTASERSVSGSKCISQFECTLRKELYLNVNPAEQRDIIRINDSHRTVEENSGSASATSCKTSNNSVSSNECDDIRQRNELSGKATARNNSDASGNGDDSESFSDCIDNNPPRADSSYSRSQDDSESREAFQYVGGFHHLILALLVGLASVALSMWFFHE